MYEVTIITKYNVIYLEVEDINSEQMKEVLSQPYIVEVEIHRQKSLTKKLHDNK